MTNDNRIIQRIDTDMALVLVYALVATALSLVPAIGLAPAGSGMVLFVPGYALVTALFPGKSSISLTERIALSFGLSITTASVAGMALYISPPGFAPDKLYVCLSVITVACTILAYRRRQDLGPEERYSPDLYRLIRNIAAYPAGGNRLTRALIVVLALAILASISFLSYAVIVPVHGEPFTEFYVLGPDGKAGDYPLKLYPGESGQVIVGITSHEYRDVTYDLVVTLNDSVNTTRLHEESVTLASGRAWEKKIELRPDLQGTGMKLEFLLYVDGNYTMPYRTLRLWVDVTPPLYQI